MIEKFTIKEIELPRFALEYLHPELPEYESALMKLYDMQKELVAPNLNKEQTND